MARLLIEMPYIKYIRSIDSATQKNTEEIRMLYLYEDRLVTKHREFAIDSIHDLSYRSLGKNGGLLYIHTDKGVFSYILKSSPENLIQIFKDLKR